MSENTTPENTPDSGLLQPRLVRCWIVTCRELFGGNREIIGVFDDMDTAAKFLKSEDDGIEEFRMESHKIISANSQDHPSR